MCESNSDSRSWKTGHHCNSGIGPKRSLNLPESPWISEIEYYFIFTLYSNCPVALLHTMEQGWWCMLYACQTEAFNAQVFSYSQSVLIRTTSLLCMLWNSCFGPIDPFINEMKDQLKNVDNTNSSYPVLLCPILTITDHCIVKQPFLYGKKFMQ